MQTLWSRTGLSHRCACRACEQVLGAGRRATTKASRRKATFAEAFTALYSSFLATAAVVEAVRKEDRKAKVDAELEEVRNQLTELRAKRALRELQAGIPDQRLKGDDIPLSDLTDLQNRALWEQWRQIYDSEGFLADAWRANGTAEETLSLNWNHVRPFGGTRLESTTILRAECTRIMRHIQAEELDDNITQRPFTKPIHFESAVSRLRSYIKGMLLMADKLCEERHMPHPSLKHYRRQNKGSTQQHKGMVGDRHKRAHIKSRWPPAAGGQESQISALAQAWHAFGSPVPDYWFENHPCQKENTIRLNDEIRELFRDDNLPLDELLGHISLSILRSPSLPDVHTHNLLMAGFTRRRFYVLASQAYELFFSDSNKLRSTPASLALSVTKPAMFWDIAEFKRAAGAIIGRDPMIGAKIARRRLEDVTRDGFVLSWATDSARRGIAGRWVYAYAPMDLALREALISSLLHLRQHVDAASFFLACLQTGASVAAGVVFELFNAIAKTPDARSAVRLVRGLSVRSKQFGEFLTSLPEEIRGCVCRRLDYLLHIINLRRLDTQFVDETITELGMCRRHLEGLLGILEEQGYSNEAMNVGRSTFNMYNAGFQPVSSSKSRALSRGGLSRQQPTTTQRPLKDALEQWAPDLDSDQVARHIHQQIRNAVQAEVEKQIRDQARVAVKLRVQAHLRKHAQDAQSNQSTVMTSGRPSDAVSGQHGLEASSITSRDNEDVLRRQIEADIEDTIRVQVQQQVEEHLEAARENSDQTHRSLQHQAVPSSGRWLGKLKKSHHDADEWFPQLGHAQQASSGS